MGRGAYATSRPQERTSSAPLEAAWPCTQSKKRESSFKLDQEREHDAMVQKMVRLRELRLAKEAADRETAAAKPAARPKARRATPK